MEQRGVEKAPHRIGAWNVVAETSCCRLPSPGRALGLGRQILARHERLHQPLSDALVAGHKHRPTSASCSYNPCRLLSPSHYSDLKIYAISDTVFGEVDRGKASKLLTSSDAYPSLTTDHMSTCLSRQLYFVIDNPVSPGWTFNSNSTTSPRLK